MLPAFCMFYVRFLMLVLLGIAGCAIQGHRLSIDGGECIRLIRPVDGLSETWRCKG